TVCAPSRCALITGLHTGHARIRGNAQVPLQLDDLTVAEVLKPAGYRTAIIGKWGLGNEGTTGVPNRHGFDEWFGYLDQVHAHNYYPEFLWRNERKWQLGSVARHQARPVRRRHSRADDRPLARPHQSRFNQRSDLGVLGFSPHRRRVGRRQTSEKYRRHFHGPNTTGNETGPSTRGSL